MLQTTAAARLSATGSAYHRRLSIRRNAAMLSFASCIALPHPQARGEEVAARDLAATLPQVKIMGRRSPPADPWVARRGRLGVLGDADVMDVPFNVTNYTAQAIQNQQAATVAEVVANDPSVRVSVSPGGLLDAMTIRGFPVSEGNLGEFAFDGVFGVAPNFRVLSDYAERVELVKGPTALLHGMAPNSGVGGSINVVPKRAGDVDLTQVTADFSSRSQVGTRVDLSRRLGPRRELGVRVNGSLREGDTMLDKQSRNARVGAATLDYRGAGLKATLDVVGQHERLDAPSRPFFVASGIAVPSAPDSRRNVTQAWEWSKIDDQSLLLRGDYEIGPALKVFAHAGGARTRVDRLFGTPTLLNAAGDVRTTPQRFQFDIHRSTAEAGLRARLRTGPLQHALTLQATRYRDRLERGSVNGTVLSTNLYAPVEHPVQAVAAPVTVPRVSETALTGLALADTLEMFDQRVLLTLGVRVQQVESDNFDASTGALTQHYDKRATTPLIGLVVKPRHDVSLYANYIEGLSKGDVAPSTASNAGEVLAPYRSRQGELGVKIDHGALTTTASIFQITKPSGQTTGTVFAADAEQRNRGLELNIVGEAVPTLRLLGGVTWLDATITKSGNAAALGRTPVGVPRLQANLGAEWDVRALPGLTLTGGVFRTGRQQVDAANTQGIPAWTRVDLAARYATTIAGKATTLRAGVRNVFDRDHWSGVSSFGGLAQGAPRTVQLSATVDL